MNKQVEKDEQSRLVLFDFEGTLSNRDSLFDFLRFISSATGFYAKLLRCLPNLLAFKLGLISNQKAKEKLLLVFLKGKSKAEIELFGKQYSEQRIPLILRPGALECVLEYLAQGDKVVIISASPELWLYEWCQLIGVELLGTRLEFDDLGYTGKFLGKNCYGDEKVVRLKGFIAPKSLDDFSRILAYGDSAGDKAMFACAHEIFYKPFR